MSLWPKGGMIALNNEFLFVYVLITMIALCVAGVVVINIVNKPTALKNEEDVDFFTKIIRNREHMLEVSMPSLSIKNYLLLCVLSPVVFIVVFWIIFPNKLLAIVMGLFMILLPDFVIRIIVETRRKKFEERYLRALKTMAAGLRAGMSIQQAVQEVMNNVFIDEGIREGFRQIDADIRVGISIDEAFSTFAEKVDNDDARDVASAIAMQVMVGGSEGKVVDSIAVNIEERMNTRRKIRSIFSATDYMIKFFDVVPFLAVILMYIALPDIMEPTLEDPLMVLLVALLMLVTVVGSIFIRKRIRITKGE